MTETAVWAWAALLLLGAYHGINPGMGWLFAVALGMQEKTSRAVWRSLAPIAAGHALSIGGVVFLAAAIGMAIPLWTLKIVVAVLLIARVRTASCGTGIHEAGGCRSVSGT
jgi:hypothetical protein